MDPEVVKLFGILTAIGLSGGVVYAVVSVVGVVTRRLEGRVSGPDPEELEYLRERAEQVELLEQRMAELETRVDFAERLLTGPPHDPATPNPDA